MIIINSMQWTAVVFPMKVSGKTSICFYFVGRASCCLIWKESLNSHSQQIHQYQQHEQPPLTWNIGNMGTGFGQKCVGVKQINKILSLPLLIKRSGRPKGKARMNNLETQTTFGTQETRPRQEKQNIQHNTMLRICAGLFIVVRLYIPLISTFYNWISNSNTDMNKRLENKHCTASLLLKRPHTMTKMNDNISIDSTISGSMNVCS